VSCRNASPRPHTAKRAGQGKDVCRAKREVRSLRLVPGPGGLLTEDNDTLTENRLDKVLSTKLCFAY